MLADPYRDYVLNLSNVPGEMKSVDDFNTLGTKSIGPMGLRSHEMMLAIFKHLGAGKVLTVKSDQNANDNKLAMLVTAKSWPVPHYASYSTSVSQCSLPILDEVGARDTIKAFMQKLDRPLLLRNIEIHHPLLNLLKDEATDYKILKQWQRASINTVGNFDVWMAENFDHKRRKELKRLRKRLEEQGRLELATLTNASDLPRFIDEFLQLEDASWKGNNGTSIKQEAKMEATLRSALRDLHANGKLRFWALRFNGETIASLYAVVDQKQATLGKITFNQAHAKYSPGVLLVIDATQSFFDCPNTNSADSNAIPGHPMIDRIWRDRLDAVDVLLAPTKTSRLSFNLLKSYDQNYTFFRSQLKKSYYRIKGVQPS